jgi:hypothetical protein
VRPASPAVLPPRHFVGRQIIPQHDVAGLQSRTQGFADPAVKNLAIAGAVTALDINSFTPVRMLADCVGMTEVRVTGNRV